MYGIDMNKDIEYITASLRYFAPNEYHVSRHCDFDVLLMVFDGVLRFEEDGKAYELFPGQYHIQKHNSYQTGPVASSSPKYLYVHFRSNWTFSDDVLPVDGNFSVSDFMPLMSNLDALRYGQTTKVELLAAFLSILSKLLRHDAVKEDSIASMVIQSLTEDIVNPPSLDDICEKLHYSKNQLIRLVKKEYGYTPYAYLQKQRLNHSLQLIESTSLSFFEIAEKCGFPDYSSFSKYFRREIGISPKEYRKKVRIYAKI